MMRQAAADGAFVSVNHPRPLGPPWSYPDATGYHAIEVWNGPWLALNAVSLGVWDAHLRRGERVIAVGGSDTHYLRPRPDRLFQARLGQPTTWVETGDAPLSVASILAALKAGRSFVSAARGGPQVYLARPEPGIARVRVVGAAGGVVLLISAVGPTAAEAIRTADFSWNVRLAGPTPYVRAQVMDPNGSALALSNPVWSLPPT